VDNQFANALAKLASMTNIANA